MSQIGNMAALKFTLFAILTLVSAEYVSYKDYKIYKLIPENDKQVQILIDLQNQYEYEFWSELIKVGVDVKIMVAPEKKTQFEVYLKDVGVKAEVVIENVQELIDAQTRRPNIGRNNDDYDWSYYQNLDEIYEWMDKLAADYPDIVTIISIGKSFEGRDIKGVKIDYKKQIHPTVVMLEGGLHAREWLSPATLTWITNEFLTSSDPNVRLMAESMVWHIIPVTNPDGYVYTFTNNRMWRKTRSTSNITSCAEWGVIDDMSHGVDLNRNFGFRWNTIGASSNPCSNTYAGPYENSEPETLAIINHVYAIQEQGRLVYYIAFHSYAEMLLIPYSDVGGSDVLEVENYGDLFEIGIRGMDKLKERYGTEYIVGTSTDVLYSTSGSSDDWAKGIAKIPFVFLFELRDKGLYGFLVPPEQIVPNNQEVLDGLIEMDRVRRQLYYASGYDIPERYSKFWIMLSLAAMLFSF